MRRGRAGDAGSAAVELAALLPLVALFIVAALTLGGMLEQALDNLLQAHAAAEQAIRRWEAGHSRQGFTRPCLEQVEQTVFRSGKRELQEVRIVGEPICSP